MKEKLWTKDFILTFVANFFCALIFYLLMVTLAAYATNSFHASASMAGLVVSIFAIGALLARVFTGKYMEVMGRSLITKIGIVFFLLTALAYIPIKSLPLLIIVRFFNGFSFGISSTCLQTIGMTLVPDSRRGEGTGYFMLSQNFATAAGPFLGLYLFNHFNYTVIFSICSACAALCLIFILMVHIRNVELSDEDMKRACSGFKLKDTIELKAVPISVFMLVMSLCYGAILSFMNSYAIETNLKAASTWFFVVYAGMLLIARPIAGSIQDKKGDNYVIYPSIISYAIGFFILFEAKSGFMFLLSAAFFAMGYGTLLSCCQAMAIKKTTKQRYGLAVSTFFICCDSGVGIGPVILGMLAPSAGFRGVYIACAVIVVISLITYFLLQLKKKKSEQVILPNCE